MDVMQLNFSGNCHDFTVDYVMDFEGWPTPLYVSYYSLQNDAQQKLYKVEPGTHIYRVLQYHLGKIFGWY